MYFCYKQYLNEFHCGDQGCFPLCQRFRIFRSEFKWKGSFYAAKCNLGKVKLERVGLRSSPIAVRDMRGGPLGSCRASLGICS